MTPVGWVRLPSVMWVVYPICVFLRNGLATRQSAGLPKWGCVVGRAQESDFDFYPAELADDDRN